MTAVTAVTAVPAKITVYNHPEGMAANGSQGWRRMTVFTLGQAGVPRGAYVLCTKWDPKPYLPGGDRGPGRPAVAGRPSRFPQ